MDTMEATLLIKAEKGKNKNSSTLMQHLLSQQQVQLDKAPFILRVQRMCSLLVITHPHYVRQCIVSSATKSVSQV